MNLPDMMRINVNRTSTVSIIARNTNGAHLSILSKSYPPTSVKSNVPVWPKKANIPIIVPLIEPGIPRIKRTSIEIASTTVNIIKRQHMVFEKIVVGSFIHMNE